MACSCQFSAYIATKSEHFNINDINILCISLFSPCWPALNSCLHTCCSSSLLFCTNIWELSSVWNLKSWPGACASLVFSTLDLLSHYHPCISPKSIMYEVGHNVAQDSDRRMTCKKKHFLKTWRQIGRRLKPTATYCNYVTGLFCLSPRHLRRRLDFQQTEIAEATDRNEQIWGRLSCFWFLCCFVSYLTTC